MSSLHSIARLCAGLALAASLGGTALSASTAAAAPLPPCVDPVCVSQQGNVVVVVVSTGANASGQPLSIVPAPAPAGSSTQATAASGPVPPGAPGAIDLAVGTYAQRQALRDQYRGQIDELTFNDELSDGVGVYQALADAMAARATPKPTTAR